MIGSDLGNQGVKDDYIRVPYVFGNNSILAHLNTSYYHIHGKSFCRPDHADSVLLTAGAGAWDLTGNITEVIPENSLNLYAFDLHWINISDISATGKIQIDIYAGNAGEEVLIGSTQGHRSSNFISEGPKRIQIPQQLKNTRISCRLSDSTAGALTCRVSFEGHYYGA